MSGDSLRLIGDIVRQQVQQEVEAREKAAREFLRSYYGVTITKHGKQHRAFCDSCQDGVNTTKQKAADWVGEHMRREHWSCVVCGAKDGQQHMSYCPADRSKTDA